MIKNKLQQQLTLLHHTNNKIEYIIDHKNRNRLDIIILDYLIIQRSKLELMIQTTTYAMNSSDIEYLESIYKSNSFIDLDNLNEKLDNYIRILDKKYIL